jgi:hypothetical protein
LSRVQRRPALAGYLAKPALGQKNGPGNRVSGREKACVADHARGVNRPFLSPRRRAAASPSSFDKVSMSASAPRRFPRRRTRAPIASFRVAVFPIADAGNKFVGDGRSVCRPSIIGKFETRHEECHNESVQRLAAKARSRNALTYHGLAGSVSASVGVACDPSATYLSVIKDNNVSGALMIELRVKATPFMSRLMRICSLA